MGKGKNKSRKGGHESIRKEDVDPILVVALARPDSSSCASASDLVKIPDLSADLIESLGKHLKGKTQRRNRRTPHKLREMNIQVTHQAFNKMLRILWGRFPGKNKLLHRSWIPGKGFLSPLSTKEVDGSYFSLCLQMLNLRFENEAISRFLVWVQLRNIPLDLWSPNVLGKNCSKLGKSIHMDKLTAQKERVTYTRCLVEVNMAKDLAHTIMINLLSGQVYEHAVFYENLSRFCPHCKIARHTENGCKVKKTNSNKAEPTKAAETVTNVEKESGPKVAETRGIQGASLVALRQKRPKRQVQVTKSVYWMGFQRLTKINYSLQASNPNSKWGAKEQAAAADPQSLEWRDFNNVLDSDGNANGLPVTMYEIRDFKNCCYDIGISDLRSIGGIHTSSNNSVWSKLDRAMVNNKWIRDGLIAHVNFDLPRKFSDHSPYTVTLLGKNDRGASTFKFFNIWAKLEKFLELVSNVCRMQMEGTSMYKFYRKLKALKGPLKALNRQHFSQILARAEAVEEELI
ncbi:hypothetical protein Acr_00g0034110 [Actinidia rufa]|uniref:DUF4283 domain-containing protein n=1 Tax=Actinidia rufa TaxID=165716 RepID=A0A7J0DFU6_9ERIC|nr:hypothetical protein Acr_00g0034110 [Actinidia rufa]